MNNYEQPWQQDEQYTEDNSQYNDTYYAHQQHRSVPPNYQKHEHSRTSRLNPMDDYGKPAPCRSIIGLISAQMHHDLLKHRADIQDDHIEVEVGAIMLVIDNIGLYD